MLFGPTDTITWGPPQDGPHRVLWKGIGGDPHADEPHPGLAAIEVSEVLAAFASLPQAQALGRRPLAARTAPA